MGCIQELSPLDLKGDLHLPLRVSCLEQEKTDLVGGLKGFWNMICVGSGMKGLDAARVLLCCL